MQVFDVLLLLAAHGTICVLNILILLLFLVILDFDWAHLNIITLATVEWEKPFWNSHDDANVRGVIVASVFGKNSIDAIKTANYLIRRKW